jgi:hypothetical protein
MNASRANTGTRIAGTTSNVVRAAPRSPRSSPPTRDYPWAVYLVIAVVCFGLTVFASTDYVRTMFERMFQ